MPIPTNDGAGEAPAGEAPAEEAPVPRHADLTAIMPPMLFAPVGWYTTLAQYGRVVVDTAMRYDKRAKGVHRYHIADVRGPLALTVPVGKPQVPPGDIARWRHCPVSPHDEWWTRHRITLESAYGRTPYFEYLIDDFLPLLRSPQAEGAPGSVIELARRADAAVRRYLPLATEVVWAPADTIAGQADVVDLRRMAFDTVPTRPYWQVRAHTLGFIGGRSILDVLFNLGPETALLLV